MRQDNREEIDAYICYQQQKRERGSEKTSGCARLLSCGQRSVRGVKNETKGAYGCVHRTYMYFYCSYILKTLSCSVIRK